MPAIPPDLIVLQTADPFRYAPMLEVTRRNVADYCRRHGFAYEAFVGISRGFYPWQASYNRIPLMQALLDRGHRGWVLYLDADAYIADLGFDLTAYLAQHADRAAILATSGVSEARWDVNDGVMLVNLGHPEGARLIARWTAKFAGLSDDRLRAAEQWIDDDNDQDLLHQILREEAAIADAIWIESRDLLNSAHARFIRQHLRSHTPDLAERTRAIAREIEALDAPALVVAPDAGPLAEPLLAAIVARWRTAPAGQEIAPHQAAFATMLDSGDIVGLRTLLASMGRAAVTQGLLGGAQQHARARDGQFALQLARRTHERLRALAGAVGAPAGTDDPAALFAAIEYALGADLSPPASVGGYLGIEVGNGRIVHARMLEAIHAAGRLRVLRDAHGLVGVVEIGGGIGLTAFYAARLGIADYRLIAPPVAAALQVAVLGKVPDDRSGFIDSILLDQGTLPAMPADAAVALLHMARRSGARLFLSIDPDGSGNRVGDLVAAAGGWAAAGRYHDPLRDGHVEEIWLAE